MTLNKITESDSRRMLLDNLVFPKLDPFFSKNLNIFFYLSLMLLILMAALLFDARISTGGDDSSYLLEAMKFSKGESFPTFHGTFYSMLIGWIISLIGFHLIFFKFLSFLFLIGYQVFIFLGFRNKISPFILSSILFITGISSGVLFFGSQTYTESFYLFLEAILFFQFFVYLIDQPNTYRHITSSWKYYLGSGLTLFIMSTTRNIGITALFVLVIYFLLERKFWPTLYTLAGFFVFKIPFVLYKKLVWNIHDSDIKAQFQIMLQKDPYNKALGNEHFGGLIGRLFDNANIFLSRIFMQQIGFKSDSSANNNLLITIIIAALLIWGLIKAFQLNKKFLKVIFLYLLVSLGVTFISLNQFWSQSRLIMPYLPLLLIVLFWLPAQISVDRTIPVLRLIVIFIISFILLKNTGLSLKQAHEMKEIRKLHRSGNHFAGYSHDYMHFLAMSEWAASNIPDDVSIASRKASMSFIYGKGRIFYPINKIDYESTDSVLFKAKATQDQVVIMNDEELEKQSAEKVHFLRRYMQSLISFDNAVYSLYTIPLEEKPKVDSVLKEVKVPMFHSVEEFRNKVVRTEKRTSSITPDLLLNELWKNKVYFLIDANLRIHESEKTDQTINTITRYMTAINSKYYGVFNMVKQIGGNKDEPARLFKINYERCRKLGWVYNN
jgi:hypothetical protein